MKKEPLDKAVREMQKLLEIEYGDFFCRTEQIDGPEIEGFAPTLQELMQLVKFHIHEFLEFHGDGFGMDKKIPNGNEDAIWSRLYKIRRLMREDDFKYAVEVACIQFGEEVDIHVWWAFLHGDEALRRDTALEIQKTWLANSSGFSERLIKRITEAAKGHELNLPSEVQRRMA